MVKDFANNNEDIFMELDSFGTICLNYCDIFRLDFFSTACFSRLFSLFLFQFHSFRSFMCQIDSVVSLEIYLGCQQLIYVF